MLSITRPRLNRLLGWMFLIAGFVWAAGLDPWSLSERDPEKLLGSPRMIARHAQAVLLAMGFLQLSVAMIFQEMPVIAPGQKTAAWLAALGGIIYVVGWLLADVGGGVGWLVPGGAFLGAAGLFVLLWTCLRAGAAGDVILVLSIFCFGMALDTVLGFFALDPTHYIPEYLGRADGVRRRMLRLARAAAIALPTVLLLLREVAKQARPSLWVQRARVGMWCGALGMPVVLILAALTWIPFKYLLPIPALAMFAGTALAFWLARSSASRLELFGWILIAISMGAGLFMGMYAFDGPMPAPGPFAEYNGFLRRISRLTHAYSIVLGLMSIFVARQAPPEYSLFRLGRLVLVGGIAVTLVGLVMFAIADMPTALLCAGPILISGGALWCVIPTVGA
jgi:hypothetical protein